MVICTIILIRELFINKISFKEMKILINSSELEGLHPLKKCQPVQLNKMRLIFVIFICILSGMVLALILKWKKTILYKLIWDKVDIQRASSIIITTNEGQKFRHFLEYSQILGSFLFRFRGIQYVLTEKQFQVLEYDGQELERTQKQQIFGLCQLDIPIIPIYEFIYNELTGGFYILQYCFCSFWIIQGQPIGAIILLSNSLMACFVNYFFLYFSRLKLKKQAQIHESYILIASGKLISGNQLVPGDIIKLKEGQVVNCDLKLLQGNILVNESSLTGEIVPVSKSNLEGNNQIYEGSIIIQANDNSAQVMRTGFLSLRGQYFRNALYPKEPNDAFFRSSFRFIIIIGVICITIYLCCMKVFLEQNLSTLLIVIRFFDLFSFFIPPAMPIFFTTTLTVGIFYLKIFKDITGTNHHKLEKNINTICFDKTGTLTQLELKAIRFEGDKMCELIIASCHHLLNINNQLTGDQLDLEMFNLSGWKIDFNNQKYFRLYKEGEQDIIVNQINDFTSDRQMMSCQVKIGDKSYLFCKGSPEKLIQKSKSNLFGEYQQYTKQGYRVIGLAYKEGDFIEDNLIFAGVLLFENKLKSDTKSVINNLQQCKLQLRMITGDNPFTAKFCAQQLDMILDCPILDYQNDQYLWNESTISFQSLNESLVKTDQIIITGSLWALTQQMENNKVNDNLLQDQLIEKAIVFARMKPNQKKEIVQSLQNKGKQVMMVGDGANDCSAITQADVGVSFSTSDAANTSPFSSQSDSIQCVVEILTQSRATMYIIIEIFNYYFASTLTKFVGKTILGLYSQDYGDFQLIFLNFFQNIPYMICMEYTYKLKDLNDSIPLYDMFTKQNISIIVQNILSNTIGLIIISQIISEYDPTPIPTYAKDKMIQKGYMNTAIVLSQYFYTITTGIVINQSTPFKQSIFSNKILIVFITIQFAFVTILIFNNSLFSGFLRLYNLQEIVQNFNGIQYGILMTTFILSILVQKLLRVVIPNFVLLE
ncbi:hypothetical protein pb186bvf_003530 [Paramecium bursaria]